MQYSIVNKFNLESIAFRLDPEYYHPYNLYLLNKLLSKKHKKISEIAYVTDGIHESIIFDENSKILLVSAKAPKENYFDTTGLSFISEEQHRQNPRTSLKVNDIIISSVGTIGNCAVVDESILPANSDRHVGIIRIRNDKFKPRFISTFLLSKYGKFQSIREATGNVQLNLFVYKIKEIRFPVFTDILQQKIENICLTANNYRIDSQNQFREAQTLLLFELGLLNWKPEHHLAFVKNFSDTQEVRRIDAEYFQPKYDEIEEAIKSYSGGYSLIKDEFKQNKSTFKIDDEKKYLYVEIGSINVSNGEMVPNEVLGSELPANAKRVLNKGDVIVSKVRTYRGAITIVEENGYVGSGAFTILKENGQINKETLFAFLHSKPLLAWSLKPNTGTSYPVIVDDDILNLPIPILPEEIQTQIQKKVTESFTLRKQSKHFLEAAKRAVEMAIEEDEETAMDWLNNEVGGFDA